MEFLRVIKSKGVVSSLLHILFNITLAVTLFLIIYIGKQVEVAIPLVLLSKWRIFAVRTRYWGANILANLVDITVGCSVVGLLYYAGQITTGQALLTQIVITTLYALWLIVLKPLSGRKAMALQAILSLFVGIWAIMAYAHVLSVVPFVVETLLFLVGYGAARHMLSTYKETHLSFLSMIFGLLIAEMGWVATHWTIGYGVNVSEQFKIPQLSVISLLVGLAFERFYASIRTGRSVWSSEYSAPIIFSLLATAVLLIYFSAAASV